MLLKIFVVTNINVSQISIGRDKWQIMQVKVKKEGYISTLTN